MVGWFVSIRPFEEAQPNPSFQRAEDTARRSTGGASLFQPGTSWYQARKKSAKQVRDRHRL
ncbi:uncharacterized protein PGTG_22691 [Puccinia graminis f. sp. tritici CRL 75-36-700-3]|uniref:Uncharacterized protein n=1 Tax=Puccinia graminis f. sp. tritici (strain CRL 75-36-700-3 / race SCCL) TaxID=418459 RepID=H6QV95_PUCGT|nr:uncharacterized protein PGTG_22691 [Puccinia graminis f. sp. tritici CRL 75-36-700-3]EHS62796.1 hypothetical protein PGTG_22691 [Puccinia graminis f. sp. tritici CRL 75-36-700-3]